MRWLDLLLRGAAIAAVLPVVMAASEHWTRRTRSGWATFGAIVLAWVLIGFYAGVMEAVR